MGGVGCTGVALHDPMKVSTPLYKKFYPYYVHYYDRYVVLTLSTFM